MSLVKTDELYRSNILKLLLWFGSGVFLIMILLNLMVYLTSVEMYSQRLDDWLLNESRELLELATQEGEAGVQAEIQDKSHSSRLYLYRYYPPNTQYEDPAILSVPDYPTISAVYSFEAFRLNTLMRATKLQLPDGGQLLVGLDANVIDSFKGTLKTTMLWGTLATVLILFAIAVYLSLLIMGRLHRFNHSMNQVMCGQRQVRLPVTANTDEFDVLAIHLNSMLEQIEKNESQLKSLTVDISHDLRTPLSRLKLRMEEALTSPRFQPEQKQELLHWQDELTILLDTFNSMLELSQLDNAHHKLEMQPVELQHIAQDVLDFTEPLAEEKQQTIRLKLDQPCTVHGNPSLLFRAIFNLVENAIKYTPEKGHIDITVDCYGIVVADSGVGIPAADRDRVFERLYRCDPSRSSQGFGLGLSLVKTVANLHNAAIVLRDNEPGLRARLLFSNREQDEK